ncbi:MAG TPA: hypothetical protein VHI13_20140 [Candidatus Kapabacteria bacterium]|nr:hypothetical protein [Candidatus Kapabacteria bacterium]
MNTTTRSGLWPDLPSGERHGNCIDEFTKLRGFLDCLRDSIEVMADEHDESFGSRLWVLDYVTERIVSIAATLTDIASDNFPEQPSRQPRARVRTPSEAT